MEYLTNEKLLKQQQSALFSINNSRSNSVSRFPIPSQRTTNEQVQPLRSADLFNRLEDILKQKQENTTTTRKKQKQISCILNSQPSHEGKKQNAENSCYKSPNRLIDVPTNGFLNVYNIETRNRKQTQPAYIISPVFNGQNQSGKKKSNISNQFQESQNKKKKESLKRFQDEFNNMQVKIKSRNNSVLYQLDQQEKSDKLELKENKFDINLSVNNTNKENNTTLNKLNQQLQIQNNHLQEQLQFEQNQNTKLNQLINNLNEQIAALNKQISQQQKQFSEDLISKENQTNNLRQSIQQLESQVKQKENEIHSYLNQLQEFKNVYNEMQELENLCQSMSYLGMQTAQHNVLILEMKELLQIQNNIIQKVTNNTDFPIDQLIISKTKRKPQIPNDVDYQELCQESTRLLESLIRQVKSSIDHLTERFIHDLLI